MQQARRAVEAQPPAIAPPQGPETTADGSNAARQAVLDEQTASETRSGFLDLSEAISVSRISSVLRYLADEPGDRARLRFGVEAWGGSGGVVRGRISGWADLEFAVSMNDMNFFVVAVESSGALRAGLDVGRWLKVGGQVALSSTMVEQWFADIDQAAFWLYEQLQSLDESLGRGVLPLEQGAEREQGPETVHGSGASYTVDRLEGGVAADAEVEAFGADVRGEVGRSQQLIDYVDEEGNRIPSTEDHERWSLAFEVPIQGQDVGVAYHNDWSNTVGSPAYYANGVFNEHTLDLTVPLSLVLNAAGGGIGRASEAAGDALRGAGTTPGQALAAQVGGASVERIGQVTRLVFEKLAGLMKKSSWEGQLSDKLFGSIAQQIGDLEASSRSDIGIRFAWNEFGQADGTMSLMYFRAVVHSASRTTAGSAESMPVGGRLSVENDRDNVLYETLGTETVSYIQRQYVFQNVDRPWSEFAAANQGALHALVEGIADPSHRDHVPAVASAFARGGHEAGLEALLRHWDQQHAAVSRTRHCAARIAELVREGNSAFTWLESTRVRCADDLLAILETHRGDPRMLRFLLDLLPAVETDMDGLERLLQETGRLDRYRALEKEAELEVAPAGLD